MNESTKFRTVQDCALNLIERQGDSLSNEDLAKKVCEIMGSKTTSGCISWYKSKLKSGGISFSMANSSKQSPDHFRNFLHPTKSIRDRKPSASDARISTQHITNSHSTGTRITPFIFVNKLKDEQKAITVPLARVCHHVHPAIVKRVKEANFEYRSQLIEILPQEVDVQDYLYEGSCCVFPAARRFIGRLNKNELLKYIPAKAAIIDDNRLPRHFWCYLTSGKSYSGPTWKNAGLSKFELAHIFSHKEDIRQLEKKAFEHFNPSQKPFGLFTCAANVVLLPKGTAKPTDSLEAVLLAFFKRHVELYGEDTLPGLRGLLDTEVPDWYGDLQWSDPILPPNWERNVDSLLKYRYKRLRSFLTAQV